MEDYSIHQKAIDRYGLRLVNRLESLDISEDKHYILMICNLFSEYNDFEIVKKEISKYHQIEQYLDLSEQNKYDKYSSDIDIDISVGTFRMSNNPPILKRCQIYYDDGVSIYNPKSFEEASSIGGNIWNFCTTNIIFQKYINAGGNIYFIHNVWSDNDTDFVAAIVKSKGFISVYKKDSKVMPKQEYAIWKEKLGEAFSYLKPLANENKDINCNRNMNKKLIRLTESDLHRIVKESIGKVFRQAGIPTTTYHDAFDQMEKESSREEEINHLTEVEAIREKALEAIATLNDCVASLHNWRDPRLNKKYYDDLVRKIRDLKPYFSQNSPLVLSYINYTKDGMRQPKRDEDWEPEDWFERNEHGDFDDLY